MLIHITFAYKELKRTTWLRCRSRLANSRRHEGGFRHRSVVVRFGHGRLCMWCVVVGMREVTGTDVVGFGHRRLPRSSGLPIIGFSAHKT